MAYANLRINLALRVAFIALDICLFFYLLFAARYPLTMVLSGATTLVQCALLVASVEKRSRVLASFFEAVKNADFTQNYSFPQGKAFAALKTEYEQVMGILRGYSLEREKQYRYLRTIARCIGVGLVVYDQDGRVDLCNEAFVGMMGIGALHRIEELAGVNADLLRVFREMKDGERLMLDTSFYDERYRLLIAATDFIQSRKKYRVVSVQNIRRELEENES
jgi:two-component system, NtrC family, nitrogen regulation sensor histidine kinase NtrY